MNENVLCAEKNLGGGALVVCASVLMPLLDEVNGPGCKFLKVWVFLFWIVIDQLPTYTVFAWLPCEETISFGCTCWTDTLF